MDDKEQILRDKIRKFADTKLKPVAAEVDEMDEMSWDVTAMMAKEGIFKYLIPVEYGGAGLSCVNLCIVREELAAGSIQADDTFAVSGLGSYPIIRFGTEAQKKKHLPPLANGDQVGAFALTEPKHGSDVAGIETEGVLKGDHYVINGRKCFISNGAEAEVCVLFVRTGPEPGGRGLTAFIINVKKGGPGLIAKGMKLMGPHPAYELIFEDYRIPKENMLGAVGQGMTIAMTNLDMFRVTVGAASLGMARAAYDEALNYAMKRMAFGQPLIEQSPIQFKLADMAINLEAARSLVLEVARKRDSGKHEHDIVKYASMAKVFATDIAQVVADDALQIHGGWGLMKDARVQQLFRGVRAPRIYEGTSEIQKYTIGRMIRKEAKKAAETV